MYLKGFTAKFCSLKIWIKLKIETQNKKKNNKKKKKKKKKTCV
ncbi:hypothetical protein K803_22895, partial [Salmonella enterica subsp. enterica serovar Newport str. SHSN013]